MAGYRRGQRVVVQKLVRVTLYDEHLAAVKVERIDKRLGVERLPLAECGGIKHDLFASQAGVGFVKLPPGFVLTLAQLIHARQTDIVQNIRLDIERGAVKRIKRPAAGDDNVIVAVHAHLVRDHVAASEFLAERLIAGLFDFAHCVPHLDNGKLLFVMQHGHRRPVGIEHAHGRGRKVIHAFERDKSVFEHARKVLVGALCYYNNVCFRFQLNKAAAQKINILCHGV